ncbi:hypothetical protein pb186bvf_000875 [Paramecium bursaria]
MNIIKERRQKVKRIRTQRQDLKVFKIQQSNEQILNALIISYDVMKAAFICNNLTLKLYSQKNIIFFDDIISESWEKLLKDEKNLVTHQLLEHLKKDKEMQQQLLAYIRIKNYDNYTSFNIWENDRPNRDEICIYESQMITPKIVFYQQLK